MHSLLSMHCYNIIEELDHEYNMANIVTTTNINSAITRNHITVLSLVTVGSLLLPPAQ